MRDKRFIIDSIKMDLYRVVTATGNITKALPYKSVSEFMEHADKDFDKAELTPKEISLRKQLKKLLSRLQTLNDPRERLRWTEDVMTIRCRL